MTEQLGILLATAVSIAFLHTLIGIDHYVPFIALGKANRWSMRKTLLIALVCGAGHVLSSVVLGGAGIGLSMAVSSLVDIESIRGEIATYFLIGFGLVYMVYGLLRAKKPKPHTHTSPDGHSVMHLHSEAAPAHEHHAKGRSAFWGLFILFVLGPCEPLIPLLMYPAATHNALALVLVTVCFAVCTLATMLLMTFLGLKGAGMIKQGVLERYSHAFAGFAVFACGIMIYALPI